MSDRTEREGTAMAEGGNVSGPQERRSFLKRLGLWSFAAAIAALMGFLKRGVADEDAVRVRALADPSGPTPQSCEGAQQCKECHWACNYTTCS